MGSGFNQSLGIWGLRFGGLWWEVGGGGRGWERVGEGGRGCEGGRLGGWEGGRLGGCEAGKSVTLARTLVSNPWLPVGHGG